MTASEQLTRELALALSDIVHKGRFANSVIQKKFSENRHWSEEERSLFAESLYAILRNWRRLWHVLSSKESEDLRGVMKVCVCCFVLNRIAIAKPVLNLLNVDAETLRARWRESESKRVLRNSYPDWLDQLCFEVYGARWDALAQALHADPKVVLRANTLLSSAPELTRRLVAQGIYSDSTSLSPDAIVLRERYNVFALEEFKKGFFEVQDAGSQCVAPFCDLSPGMRVIDACAGSGGKSLHLAALLQNKGRVLSLDTEKWKLTDLVKRARRAGASIIETRLIDSTKVVKRLHNSADRVLLDVPCSGLGVLRRNPDTKWHLTQEDLARFSALQREILQRYSLMVSANGKLIYATCSILPQEGEEQVRWFLKENPNWQIEEQKRVQPDTDDCDGFYMARLRRVETT